MISLSSISCIWLNNLQAGRLRRKGPLPPLSLPEPAGAVGPVAPGRTESEATGQCDSEFRLLGAAALAENLESFAFGPGDDSERPAFVEKVHRGMISGLLGGHSVCGLPVSAVDVVVLDFSMWGEQGVPHPDVSSLPLRLLVLVLSWVTFHRR